ncbi:MAG: hypothetical protein U0R24_00285 [Solirubrobacterales bacterium]
MAGTGARLGLLALAALLSLLALGGCGGGDGDGGASETVVTETSTSTVDDGAADASSGPSAAVQRKLSAELDRVGEQAGAQVGGTIGIPGAAPLVLGSLQSGAAWSTIKVPIALQVIDEAGGAENLTGEQRADVTAAITQSDNDAAARLFDGLVQSHGSVEAASDAVTQLLRKAGDEETTVSSQGRDGYSSYGQTEWSLTAQQTFMGALLNGCIGDASGRELVLGDMGKVTSDTWGLGSAGVPALWKGGWGPGTDGAYLVRQMGQIEVGGSKYAIAIAAIADDGAFESGQNAATQVASWLADHAAEAGNGTLPGC